MQIRRIFVLCGVTVALVLASAAAALAAGTKVTVRVEGKSKTLLSKTTAQTHGGSITKGGAPTGKCPATSAAGALADATHGNWAGTFKSSFNDYELTSILGESWPFSATSKYYWSIWVNSRYATTGMCEINLHRGDHVLFAVDSVAHHEHPLGLTAPRTAKVGHSFKIKVVWLSDSGKAKPLRGVRLMGSVTNRDGQATITPTKRGKLRLKASKKGYIRSIAAWVRVSG
jgi:hypothetical protein